MKTLAERFGFQPTKFLPNGCGAGVTSKLIPDIIAGADFKHCCDLHDLAYHIGRGGFLGLFYVKPVVDLSLARCMTRQFKRRAGKLKSKGKIALSISVSLLSFVVPYIYLGGLTLLGWTPLTWPWKERPKPTHAQLITITQMTGK